MDEELNFIDANRLHGDGDSFTCIRMVPIPSDRKKSSRHLQRSLYIREVQNPLEDWKYRTARLLYRESRAARTPAVPVNWTVDSYR